jgi:UBX domain-containing protein 1
MLILRNQAKSTLEQADWDYKTAVQLWYASLEEAPEALDDMEEDDPQPIPSTSGASGSGPSAGASSSRQARQGGGFRTLQDLTSGDGHDQDDDDDHSDNDYFTGGEKSGLAVHGGNRDPQDHIQSLLDRARR